VTIESRLCHLAAQVIMGIWANVHPFA
jgi:hypothetical protein